VREVFAAVVTTRSMIAMKSASFVQRPAAVLISALVCWVQISPYVKGNPNVT
jgi:hypothetical protein